MQIHEAINASEYSSAAAYAGNGVDIIVGADGHDGFYGYARYTSEGQQGEDVHSVTLADIEAEYPNLNWWPLRENGAWGEDAEPKCAYCGALAHNANYVPAAYDDEAWQAEATHHAPTCEWVATRAHTREARAILINDRAIMITAEEYDHGYAPEATDEQGQSVYLGGEDDEDDATPAEALTRGERYLREQAERGNL